MATSARVLVIGLDSADAGLVEAWSAAGDLPALAALRARGVHGTLRSPTALGDDAVWPSFSTSVAPGRHGRWSTQVLKDHSYGLEWFSNGRLGHESFWDELSRAGRRVAIIDVPKTPLSPTVNGFQLVDWRAHGRDSATRSTPPAVATEVLARFGEDRTDRPGTDDWLCWSKALPADRREELARRLLVSVEEKRAFAEEQVQRGPWDLFLVVFKEAHCLGHQCPGSGDDDQLRAVYRAIDTAVGRLVDLAGPEATVLLFSPLGMGSNITGDHLLDDVLLRLDPPRPAWATAIRSIGLRCKHRLRHPRRPSIPVDPRSARRAFQVAHNESSGAVRFNLRGREPSGRVRPGNQAAALATRLRRELGALADPDTGAPIVGEVVVSDELWPGPQRHRLPDLFVVWNRDRDREIDGAASASIGEVRIPTPPYRPANHTPDGFFLAAGPGVPSGLDAGSASIMDIGPTVARLLEVALPTVDGVPIAALWER